MTHEFRPPAAAPTSPPATEKVCRSCHAALPLTAYRRAYGGRVFNACKACMSQRSLDWYYRNKERVAPMRRAYSKTYRLLYPRLPIPREVHLTCGDTRARRREDGKLSCCACQRMLEPAAFCADRGTIDKVSYRCRACTAARKAQRRAAAVAH